MARFIPVDALGTIAYRRQAGAKARATLMEPLFVTSEGAGPTMLFVHGTAADLTTWNIQALQLKSKLRLVLYDRRGTGKSPTVDHPLNVADHAEDAARIIEAEGGPMFACGSSFGAVVLLELMRRRPELIKGAVLLEPPLPPVDDQGAILGGGFLQRFDEIANEKGGPAAGEYFLRSVLTDALYERVPRPFQERSKAMWKAIRQDCVTLGAYRVGYDTLSSIRTPVLLCGGERSYPTFGPTLEALKSSLGNATLELLPNAGHMMHAEAARTFNPRLVRFVEEHSAQSRARS